MGKQVEMKGKSFENDPDPEIERALAAWEDAQEEAAKHKTTADRRRDELIAKLQAKKSTRYKSTKCMRDVLLENNAKLKVTKIKAPKEEDDGEE
jgi:hypothetical protein